MKKLFLTAIALFMILSGVCHAGEGIYKLSVSFGDSVTLGTNDYIDTPVEMDMKVPGGHILSVDITADLSDDYTVYILNDTTANWGTDKTSLTDERKITFDKACSTTSCSDPVNAWVFSDRMQYLVIFNDDDSATSSFEFDMTYTPDKVKAKTTITATE